MDIVKLKAQVRSGKGTGYNRKARVKGWIPAVYYGHKIQPANIEVDAREFATLVRRHKTSHLIDLGITIPGSKDSIAVIKEVQRHVINDGLFFHIDFQHVSMDEKITVAVPCEISGIPIGVKDDGGILNHPMKHIHIECLPMDIPEKIVVDVTALKVGESIHVKDITAPDKVTIKDPGEEVIAVVTRPMKEEVVAAVAAVEGEAAATADGAAEGAAGASKATDKPAAGAPKATDKPAAGGEKAGSKDKGKKE